MEKSRLKMRTITNIANTKIYHNIEKSNVLNNWDDLVELCNGKTFAYSFRKTQTRDSICLFLCQTGPTKAEDNRCKYGWLSIHSGVITKSGICCAGICTFKKSILYMDNLSGTYQPNKIHLTNMIHYLKTTFMTPNIQPIIFISNPNPKEMPNLKNNIYKNLYTKHFTDSPDYKVIMGKADQKIIDTLV